ncbi:GNAT family N-acetyltransferase [Rheinheimera sp.]|uniref:GNAT family N-acetyltransferase n=1 Tax=Rheinheimera sp. TaxID=1869214 RepID=UPI002733B7DF|nr:GNAT family N-acetyltransferase [Rheinheimera sp.]MDP2715854.1 GNAT family N-acetyltransferase [Rheinheimera sp.]
MEMQTEQPQASDIQDTTPFFTRQQWFEHFEQHIVTDSSVIWLPLTQQPKAKVLPLLSPTDNQKAFQIRSLLSMSNYYSPVYGLVNSELSETIGADELCDNTVELLKGYDSINISPIYEQQATDWLNAFKQIGFTGHRYQHSVNWYHNNITDIQQYWALRPPRLLNTLKRKREQMQKAGEFTTQVFSNGSQSQLIQALIDYHHVYYHSWKQKEPYPAFIDAVAEYAWHRNELRIGIIYHQQRPIAAQIWFVCKKTAYIFKLAHVESYTRFSPGTVLMAVLLEHVITEDNVNHIDFLTGNDSYKQDWMSGKHVLYGIHLCNKHSAKGLCLSVLDYAGRVRKKIPLLR